LVSIVIPVFNRQNIICQALDSALGQTYKNLDIVVVDNASTDQTWEVLNGYANKYKHIRIFRNEHNLGPVRNWIRGVELARGEYVKILFSDDWMDETDIEINLRHLSGNAELAFVYNPAIIHFPAKKRLFYQKASNNKIINSRKFIRFLLLNNNVPVSPCCALFRRNDLLNNILLNIENKKNIDFSNFGAGNDLLMFLLTARQYPSVFYCEDVKINFLAHKGSLTVENDLSYFYARSRTYFIEKYYAGFYGFFLKLLVYLKIPRVNSLLNIYKSKYI
jgi:glycosyltransferase involved in cell wall biosynthesis